MQISSQDRIERARAEWASELSDLDTSPMEIIGRILRAEHLADARIRRVLREEAWTGAGSTCSPRSGAPGRLTG